MSIRGQVAELIKGAVRRAQEDGLLPAVPVDDVAVERPQDTEHGDFSSSLPLKLASPMRMDPMAIADRLLPMIADEDLLERVSASHPGFINLSLRPSWIAGQVDAIRSAGETYGNNAVGAGRRIQVEFVSVNPTGPVHVGHARGAVLGSTLANMLEASGYEVVREYYFNDAGSQRERFDRSLVARYQQQFEIEAEIPTDGYRGEYLVDLAREIAEEEGNRFLSLGEEEATRQLGELGLQRMIESIQADVDKLRVSFDVWFSESSLYKEGQYDTAMGLLKDAGYLAERDGATWFTSTALGDDKDKVVVRSSGAPTYFATDVAYHYNKFFERRFDRVVDILGADHQGHVSFMKAVASALGVEADRLDLLVYQLVTLKRGDETVRASKRTGDLITLRELVDEVGPDACRFFFLSRSPDSQMEFDIELAKEQSPNNPVYYIQYAHARIAGILRLAKERGVDYADGDLSLLTHEAELALIRKMLVLPEMIETVPLNLEAHHLPHYAQELATAFHWFYQQCRVVSSVEGEEEITKARVKLVEAAKIVLARCLGLMGMHAPDRM